MPPLHAPCHLSSTVGSRSQDGQWWCLVKVLHPRNMHMKDEHCTFYRPTVTDKGSLQTDKDKQMDEQSLKQYAPWSYYVEA